MVTQMRPVVIWIGEGGNRGFERPVDSPKLGRNGSREPEVSTRTIRTSNSRLTPRRRYRAVRIRWPARELREEL